jgi:predicted RecA/RadA family phage recombinase
LARYDKYEPRAGGFRAVLNAAIAAVDVGKLYAVAINGSNRVIRTGIGATADIVGVICAVRPMNAGDVVDVMTHGEIVEALETAGTAFADGAKVYGHTDGTVDDTATTSKYLGQVVEATGSVTNGKRLVIRVALGPAAGLTA